MPETTEEFRVKYTYIDHIDEDMPFAQTCWLALIATQQMAAGCPPDCDESSASCDKDPAEMPPECYANYVASMDDDDCGCSCCYR